MAKKQSINPHAPVNNKPLYDEVTEEMITDWKSKHKAVKAVSLLTDYYDEDEEIDDDAERSLYIICRPERRILNIAAKFLAEKNYTKSNEVMIKNCVLAGDMSLITGTKPNDVVLDALMEELNKTLNSRGVEVKKL